MRLAFQALNESTHDGMCSESKLNCTHKQYKGSLLTIFPSEPILTRHLAGPA